VTLRSPTVASGRRPARTCPLVPRTVHRLGRSPCAAATPRISTAAAPPADDLQAADLRCPPPDDPLSTRCGRRPAALSPVHAPPGTGWGRTWASPGDSGWRPVADGAQRSSCPRVDTGRRSPAHSGPTGPNGTRPARTGPVPSFHNCDDEDEVLLPMCSRTTLRMGTCLPGPLRSRPGGATAPMSSRGVRGGTWHGTMSGTGEDEGCTRCSPAPRDSSATRSTDEHGVGSR
jgi:hypothetical protein